MDINSIKTVDIRFYDDHWSSWSFDCIQYDYSRFYTGYFNIIDQHIDDRVKDYNYIQLIYTL